MSVCIAGRGAALAGVVVEQQGLSMPASWLRNSRAAWTDRRRRRGGDQVGDREAGDAGEDVHPVFVSVQWCIGQNNTGCGSSSCRKPDPASDSDR